MCLQLSCARRPERFFTFVEFACTEARYPARIATEVSQLTLWVQATKDSCLVQVRDQREAIDEETSKSGAEALVQQALRKGTVDNVTAVVLMMDWPEP